MRFARGESAGWRWAGAPTFLVDRQMTGGFRGFPGLKFQTGGTRSRLNDRTAEKQIPFGNDRKKNRDGKGGYEAGRVGGI